MKTFLIKKPNGQKEECSEQELALYKKLGVQVEVQETYWTLPDIDCSREALATAMAC